MNNKVLIFINVIFISSVHAQPALQWTRTYNGPASQADVAGAVVVDDSGYVYVTGILNGTLTNDLDYCTIKYKPQGDTSWVRIYSRADSFAVARDMKVDASGNVYVTGIPTTIKYDKYGNIVWLISTPSVFHGTKIELDNSGNIYVGGINSLSKYTLRKYNNNGLQLWSTTYDDGGGGTVKDMIMDKLDNIILVGEMAYNNGNSYDFFTMKFNSSGDTLWSRSYNGPGSFPPYDWANAVAVDDTGNIYVTGLSQDPNRNSEYLTVKYDSSGIEKWMKRYSGGIAYDIEVDKTGNVFVAGVTGLSNYTTLKYNNGGLLQWAVTVPAYPFATSVLIKTDSAGNVYVGGARQSDLLVIKYNTSGIEQWTILHPQGSANDIAIDKYLNVYATGIGPGPGMLDYLTVMYSQPIGITPISNELLNDFSLLQNYPNPFNTSTKIRLDIPRLSFIKLIVYDVLGREVTELVNQELKAGSYNAEWDAGSYGSGLYFYELISDNITIDTKKMILIK